MSDEKEIRDVRDDELRAAKGKPPRHTREAERQERLRAAMRLAIMECDEASFVNAIHELGHVKGSAEYERMMRLWHEHLGASGRR
jgi:hypothetical protein